MAKKLIPLVLVLIALGAGYKFGIAKEPAKAAPKPKVEGTVYMLKKEFLVNLAEGRFAKLQVGLVLNHDDVSTVPAGGHGAAPPPPEGYGPMTQEGVVRNVITDTLTDVPATKLMTDTGRAQIKRKILGGLKKQTDVKADDVLFADLTVQ